MPVTKEGARMKLSEEWHGEKNRNNEQLVRMAKKIKDTF